MKKTAVILATLVLAALGCKKQPAEDQVVARVNQEVLTIQDFHDALPQGLADIPAEGKEDLVRQWINGELLYQEAKRQGLHKDPKMAKQLKDFEKDFLANHLIQRDIIEKNSATEAEARAYFDQRQDEFQTEIRLSQILLSGREEAEQAKARLDKGEDFARLARELSADSLSRVRGGDLGGYLRRGSGHIPLDVEEAVFPLKSGGVSQPVKRPDGYRIFRVTDRRPVLERAKFDDIKEGLLYAMNVERKKKAYEELVERLKAGARVESHPEKLK
jgi:peptidyl-prolyl cis-trans isomerase C